MAWPRGERRFPRVWLSCVLMVASMTCGDAAQDADETPLRLTEIARYGWADMPAPAAETSPEQRLLGGGVLGRVTGVAQASDSTLYVLDADYRKIVAFAPDGSVRRVIAGGEGEGPGEFDLPTDLALDGRGRLAALDLGLGRVSFFSVNGEYEESISLPGRRYRLVWAGDMLWTTRLVEADEAASLGERWRPDGSIVDTLPAVPATDLGYGGGILLTTCPDGRVLVRVNRPGVWLEYDAGRWTRRGTPIYPDVPPPLVQRSGPLVSLIPAQVEANALACLPSGDVLQRHSRFVEPPDPHGDTLPALEHFLVRFAPDGTRIAGMKLEHESLGSGPFYASPVTGHVFTTIEAPWPAVVEYGLGGPGGAE